MSRTPTPMASREVRAHLEVCDDLATKQVSFPLLGERTLVGSSCQAHIVIAHPSVAPVHIALVRTALGSYLVQDVSGGWGISVRGQRVTDRLLNPGEEFRVGQFTLNVRKEASAQYRFALPGSEPPAPGDDDEGDDAPAIHSEHLASVMRLGRELAALESVQARFQKVCEYLVSAPIRARSAALLRIRGRAEVDVLQGATGSGVDEEFGIPMALISALAKTRGPVMDVEDGLAMMACPVDVAEDRMEAILATFPKEHATPDGLSLFALVAETHQHSEVIWEMRTRVRESTRLEREIEMAREIQHGLMPVSLEFDGPLRGLDVAIGFEPCRRVGGDYVDALVLPDGRILMVVADVCGKGMQAAMVASALHTAIHVVAAHTTSLPEVLERINLHLCNFLPPHSFVTMVCVALDLTTGNLEYASAGHPPAMVAQPGGTVELLDFGDNPALGMMNTRMVARTASLSVGETLLLYTDGVTDILNEQGDPLGMTQLAAHFSAILSANPSASARTTQKSLLARLSAHRGSRSPTDDTTFLVARRRGSSLRPRAT